MPNDERVTSGTEPLDVELQQIADDLRAAEDARTGIPAPRAVRPSLTLDEAYAIQRANIARRVADGETLVGHKIGLTSLAMQKQLGVDQPDFGRITDRMVVADDSEFDVTELVAPRVEAEFAFRLGRDLAPNPTRDELADAIDGVAVALEIIDSRVADWKIGLVDTVADNASSARIVTGEFAPATPERLAALPDVMITAERDGEVVCSGPGSAVLGDPLVSITWLAGAIGAYGERFAAGDVVLAGAVAAAVDLTPGSVWSAYADGFAPVTFTSTSGGK